LEIASPNYHFPWLIYQMLHIIEINREATPIAERWCEEIRRPLRQTPLYNVEAADSRSVPDP